MSTTTMTPSALVSSNDVNGTAVYCTGGEKVGEIDHLMIDKESGKVSYAVMGFGGFLGMGEGHHPVPWQKLSYDTSKGGFVTDISKEQLEGAPAHADNWPHDRAWEQRLHGYYMVPYYWI